jgi:glycosyltransferase involved in cell wall biosynthesis
MRVMWVVEGMPTDVAMSGGDLQRFALLECVKQETDVDLLVAYSGGNQGDRTSIGGVEYAAIGSLEESTSRLARVVLRWASPRGPRAAALAECARVAADWRPDVVHVHGTESGLGLISDMVEAPTVLSLQGLLSVIDAVVQSTRIQDAFTPSTASMSEFVRGASQWHGYRRMHFRAALERRILHRCLYIAGRTDFDRRAASILAPNALYLHVGELLRGPFYGPSWVCASKPREIPVLCANATNYVRKGVDTTLEAVRILLDAGSEVTLRLFGVDSDSPAGRSALAHARRLGVDKRVTLSGRLSADGVAAELLSADIYLHPSRVDNSPNSLCEAMSLGVPCIASTAGGIPSLATDGWDALLVPPGDAYSLAGAVRSMLGDRQAMAGISHAARERALQRHSHDAVRGQLLAAYERVVADAALGRRAEAVIGREVKVSESEDASDTGAAQ